MFGRPLLPSLVALIVLTTIAAAAQTWDRSQQPARDTPAQSSDAAKPAARISGQVLAADTARPVRRARVLVTAAELPGGRGMLTDDEGRFDFGELPAGRYTLTVGKTGFISLAYGQRRPLQAGTPLQLAHGQQITGMEFRLPRGSAIAGHVFDEAGDPMAGSNVRVLRYEYTQGNRQLVHAGSAQTDDQGYYRIWGLNPGQYYVSATARNFDGGRGATFAGGPPGRLRGAPPPAGDPARLGSALPRPPAPDPESVAYAPTYYPGVSSASEARAITVGLGTETLDINFGLLLVKASRVSGRVVNPDGSPATAGMVTLTPDTGAASGRGFGGNLGARVQWDGSFSIANVPPGRYTLRARSEDSEIAQFAQQPLNVADGDLNDLNIILAAAASISGTVVLHATQSQQVPDLNQIRVAAPSIDVASFGSNPSARVDKEGKFRIDGVPPGARWIRAQSSPRGWALRSVTIDGREAIDNPVTLRSGQKLANVTLTFSDKLTELTGVLSDDRGTPLTEYTVLAFTTDSSLWRPQARHIMTARPDQNGKYQMRGLPAGEYFVVAVDPTEQGEWYEPAFLDQHRAGAARLVLGDGDVKTQDFRLSLK